MTTDTTNALRRIVAVLGPSVPSSVTDRGARYEWGEALRIAQDALATAQTEAQPADCNPQIQGADCAGQPEAKGEGVDSAEDAYVIEQMGRLLAEIAVIVNGPEPALTRWSYHDLPMKVARIKQAASRAPCCGVREGEMHRNDCATRQEQGGRAYETPVSGHDPADVSTESANVDMRQAQGGGEETP